MIIDLQNIKKVYINLDRDIDRKNKFQQNISKLNYNNVERFSARLLSKKGHFNHGCSQSHHDLMIQYKTNLPLFVLEDDAKATIWYDEYVSDGKINVPDSADIIYMGISTAGSWKNLGIDFSCNFHDDKWMKLNHCLGTHAMIFLTNKGIETFIENSKSTISRKIPLDVGYAKEIIPNLNVYAPNKSLFCQDNNCIITTNVIVDPKKNEWSTYHRDGKLNFVRNMNENKR